MLDFYELDEDLNEEEKLVRDTVRQFVDKEVLPDIVQHFRDGTFPRHLIPRMAELGLLGANLQGYGCAGLGDVAYGIIMRELERGDTGVRSFVSVQGSLVMFPIHAFGSEEQKERWLPLLAAGKAIGCFGLTEPDHGSDPGGMETARRTNGRRLAAARRQALDHQRLHRRDRCGLGKTDDGIRASSSHARVPGFTATLMHWESSRCALRSRRSSSSTASNCPSQL
jgi:hypothetical protein